MKPEFHEDILSEHADPLDARVTEFPWEDVFRNLDGTTPPDETFARMAEGLGELVRWLVRGDGEDRIDVHDTVSGRRIIALAWVLHPDIFKNSPSLRALSDRIGVPVSTLSRYTAEVTRRWGLFNRAQSPKRRLN